MLIKIKPEITINKENNEPNPTYKNQNNKTDLYFENNNQQQEDCYNNYHSINENYLNNIMQGNNDYMESAIQERGYTFNRVKDNNQLVNIVGDNYEDHEGGQYIGTPKRLM